MKNLKALLEVKGTHNSSNSNKNDNVSLSLSGDDINNVLFALAYVYNNDNEADKWQRAEYESLYINIYKDVTKTLGKEILIDHYGLDPNINKVQTRY